MRPNFTTPPAWRAEFYRRLQAKGVNVDRAQYEQAGAEIDRLLSHTVTRLAFGDSAAKRRSVPDDVQLARAVQAMRQSQTQQDLFVLAQQQSGTLAEGVRK